MQLISMNMQRALGDNAEAADVYFAMLIIDFPPPRIHALCCVRILALYCARWMELLQYGDTFTILLQRVAAVS